MAPPRGKRFRAPQRPAAPGVPRAAGSCSRPRSARPGPQHGARPPRRHGNAAALQGACAPAPTVSSPVFKSPPPCARALAVGSAGRGRAAIGREAAPSHWLAEGEGGGSAAGSAFPLAGGGRGASGGSGGGSPQAAPSGPAADPGPQVPRGAQGKRGAPGQQFIAFS